MAPDEDRPAAPVVVDRAPRGDHRYLLLQPLAVGFGYLLAMATPSPPVMPSTKPRAALPPAPPAVPDEPAAEADEPAALRWQRCVDGVGECALLAVPLDHRTPRGRLVGLGVRRIAAADPYRRVGVLVINPGGPGKPVVDELAVVHATMRALMPAVARRFDLVALDVRGAGLSGPHPACVSRRGVEHLDGCFSEHSARCWSELSDAARDRAEMCARSVERDLLVGMTQENAARDLDVLRAALGEKTLSFYGFSAASRFGGLYLTLHPERVRAAVFDSPGAPGPSRGEAFRTQAVAYAKAADRFAAWCVAGPRCGARAGETGEAFSGRVQAALRQPPFVRDAAALPDGAVLAERVAHLLNGLRAGAWGALADEVEPLLRDDPHPMDAAIGEAQQRNHASASARASGLRWQWLTDDPVPAEGAGWSWPGNVPRWSGLFDVVWRMNLVAVSRWTLPTARQTAIAAHPRTPALVIIGQHDPATPAPEGAAFLEALHHRAWEVDFHGEGHAKSLNDPCLARAVQGYLLEPGVPPAVFRCGRPMG